MTDRVGQQFGNYRLLRRLGSGAFASVYLGEHLHLERPAAIKVLHVRMEAAHQEAFRREARTLARLQHPHIVGVHDFGIADQTPYLVMEYLSGGTLRQRHPRGTRLSFEQIVSYVKPLASALDYAHSQQVIHRDLKPENLLLNRNHEVVLSDFGIAVVEHSWQSLSTQQPVGTPLYMAPEQIRGKPCPASDQYALGVMVYEWLCGEPPFRGELYEVFNQHLQESPPSLRAFLPELPLAVEDAVFGALAKDPLRRFSTVQDFATVLEEACFATQSLPAISSISTAFPQHMAEPDTLVLRPSMPDMVATPISEQNWEQRPSPVSLVSVSAPSDQSYLEQWERQLQPLIQAGMLTVWSDRHMLAGMPRQQQVEEHLDRADLIVLLVSADFFSSDDCMASMELALARQRHEHIPVIPLLLRAVQWDASPLASLWSIPSNGLPITAWMDKDAAFDLCVRDLRRLLGHQTIPRTGPSSTLASPTLIESYRHILLRKVHTFWIEGVLNRSLHGAALLALGLQTQPDAVANPWHLVLQEPETSPYPLPAGTRITQVYDSAGHELLILGAPGSGKTTLLLELARDLLERAERNEHYPMPVVFNLSSWAVRRLPLTAWLVEELNSKYLIPLKFAQAFVDADQILPLLDGLDEMAAEERTACIEAINSYRLSHSLQPPVVCSRSVDYLAQTARVRLGSAVMVQPLTRKQVIDYLSTAGPQVKALRAALLLDPDLQMLATTPLMLNILTLAYQGTPLDQIAPLGTLPAKQQQIFAIYVERMLTRRGPPSRYRAPQTLGWLKFLAQQMKSHNQTIFFLEHLQSAWLTDQRMQRVYTWFAVRLPHILIGVLVFLPLYALVSPHIWTPFLLQVSLLGGLFGWLLSKENIPQHALSTNDAEAHQQPWYWPLQQLGLMALPGSGVGLSFWLTDHDLQGGLIAGLCFTACCFLLILLFPKNKAPQTSPLSTSQQPTRGKVVLGALLLGGLTGLSIASAPDLKSRIAVGLLFLLLGGLSGGILSWLLPGEQTGVQPTDRLTWTWKGLLSQRHLRSALQITGITGLLSSIICWLVGAPLLLGLVVGPVFGLCYWFLLGFFRGTVRTTIDDQQRSVPNQGIHDSALNALWYGLVVAILSGLGGWQLSPSWRSGLIIGLSVGLLAGLFNGGLACLRHAILRIVLWRRGVIPWNYPHFLDEMAERILLRKVGGGYIFVHQLLLDYLATFSTNKAGGQSNTGSSSPFTSTTLLPCGHQPRPNARFCSVCGAEVPS